MIKEQSEAKQEAAGDETTEGAEHAAKVGRILSRESQFLPTLAKQSSQLQQSGAGTPSRPDGRENAADCLLK